MTESKTVETSKSSVRQEMIWGTYAGVSQVVEAILDLYNLEGRKITNLQPFSGGLETQKWTFKVNREEYLLKVYGDIGPMFGRRYERFRTWHLEAIERRLRKAGVPVAETVKTKDGSLIPSVPAEGFLMQRYKIAFSIMRIFPGQPLENPSEEDIRNVIEQIITKIHRIEDFSVPSSYDSWSVLRLGQEYDWNEYSRDPTTREAVQLARPVVEEFSKLSLSDEEKFPRTPIHADLHPGNILKSPDRRLCLLDFGCFETGPRIVDLAIFMAFTCADLNDPERTERNFNLAVSEYDRIIGLTREEKEALPVLIESLLCNVCLTSLAGLNV